MCVINVCVFKMGLFFSAVRRNVSLSRAATRQGNHDRRPTERERDGGGGEATGGAGVLPPPLAREEGIGELQLVPDACPCRLLPRDTCSNIRPPYRSPQSSGARLTFVHAANATAVDPGHGRPGFVQRVCAFGVREGRGSAACCLRDALHAPLPNGPRLKTVIRHGTNLAMKSQRIHPSSIRTELDLHGKQLAQSRVYAGCVTNGFCESLQQLLADDFVPTMIYPPKSSMYIFPSLQQQHG